MYPKIDIYVNGEYFCSTCQASSLKDAKEKFIQFPAKATLGKNGVEMIGCERISTIVCRYSKENKK